MFRPIVLEYRVLSHDRSLSTAAPITRFLLALLLAMLVMEAAFGLPGVVAAPIYYGYLKNELSARGLV